MDTNELDFETAFARLEETVRTLERGDLALNEMISLYEEGVRLSAQCARLLDGAQLRISQIVQQADGELTTLPAATGEQLFEPPTATGFQTVP